MAQLTISLNVSAQQFRQRDFVDQVLAVLDHTGANPQRLKLERTASLLVHNVKEIIAKMSALKAEGVESEAQRDFLASSGCHTYQGCFCSRPPLLEGFELFAEHGGA